MSETPAPRWTLGQRFAFRFLFLYYVHFAFTIAPFARIPGVLPWLAKYLDLWRPLVDFTGQRVLGFEASALLVPGSVYGWVLTLCLLALATFGALAWSLLDRRRLHHLRLQAWFHWLLRILVSGALIHYGMIKLVPTQMIAPPPPGVLLFRVGELVPNHLLWWTVGASPAFESFSGLAELMAGLLLLFPSTTLIGALLATADMATVFALNLGYDVPVKTYSFHLLFLSLLLVLPHRRRLAELFLFNRRVEPAAEMPLSANGRRHRAAQLLVLGLGLYFVTESILTTRERYAKLYPPRSPFYAAWSVTSFEIEGKEIPLHTDPERWRWVSFGRPQGMTVERMDGTPRSYEVALDEGRRTITLFRKPKTPAGSKEPAAAQAPERQGAFRYRRPDPDRLELEGELEGRKAVIRLEKMELLKRRRW